MPEAFDTLQDEVQDHASDSRLNGFIALFVAVVATFMALCNVKDGNVVQAMQQSQAKAYDGEQAARYRSLKLAGLKEAPEHLLVCVDRDPAQGAGLGRATLQSTLRDSAVCAIQTLWLAARAEGVGMGWVSILDPAELRGPLRLSDSWDWVAYLCLGWPEEALETPELERLGWEHRRPLGDVLEER